MTESNYSHQQFMTKYFQNILLEHTTMIQKTEEIKNDEELAKRKKSELMDQILEEELNKIELILKENSPQNLTNEELNLKNTIKQSEISDQQNTKFPSEELTEKHKNKVKILKESGYNYVVFSENPKERSSNVYEEKLDKIVKINGQINYITDLKPGDSIEFGYISPFGDYNDVFLENVKYVEYKVYKSSCVHGDCEIVTVDGIKKMKEIVPGDYVETERGFAKVSHILGTKLDCRHRFYIKGRLLLTEFHPVCIEDEWVFPVNCPYFSKITTYCDVVYSLVLEEKTCFMVDGTKVISLGHGIENDDVAYHPFFGTQKVIENIEKLCDNNVLIINPGQLVYDVDEGIINSIV